MAQRLLVVTAPMVEIRKPIERLAGIGGELCENRRGFQSGIGLSRLLRMK